MAYLLLALFIPVAGIIFYILFGINFWKMKLYNKKSNEDEKVLQMLKKRNEGVQGRDRGSRRIIGGK